MSRHAARISRLVRRLARGRAVFDARRWWARHWATVQEMERQMGEPGQEWEPPPFPDDVAPAVMVRGDGERAAVMRDLLRRMAPLYGGRYWDAAEAWAALWEVAEVSPAPPWPPDWPRRIFGTAEEVVELMKKIVVP